MKKSRLLERGHPKTIIANIDIKDLKRFKETKGVRRNEE